MIAGGNPTLEERIHDVQRRLVLINASCALFSIEAGASLVDTEKVLDAIRGAANEAEELLEPLLNVPAEIANWEASRKRR